METSHTPDYGQASEYWSSVRPTVNGMLGGFAVVSDPDVDDSTKFIKTIFAMDDGPEKLRALDCGAGIGRVTRLLLSRFFQRVDLVEQEHKFVEKAKTYLKEVQSKVGTIHCKGLQDFTPDKATYDVIWCQWVLGHLTEEDLILFFQRCIKGLRPSGLLVVKENVTSSDLIEFDEDDSSVTRPPSNWREIFQKCNLDIVIEMDQRKFPKGLYPVKMFALKPNKIGSLTN